MRGKGQVVVVNVRTRGGLIVSIIRFIRMISCKILSLITIYDTKNVGKFIFLDDKFDKKNP